MEQRIGPRSGTGSAPWAVGGEDTDRAERQTRATAESTRVDWEKRLVATEGIDSRRERIMVQVKRIMEDVQEGHPEADPYRIKTLNSSRGSATQASTSRRQVPTSLR